VNDNNIADKIYSCLEITDSKTDPKIIDIEKQIAELNDKTELLIPPDEYNAYMEIILKQEELRHKRDFLEFTKIYKEAFKDGLLTGISLDV